MSDENEEPVLSVHNLRTYFLTRRAEFRAVDGIDFSLRAGKTLCIVGESGSGKSVTALSVMGLVDSPGLLQPGSEISFRGIDLLSLSGPERRRIRGRNISMVFQEPMTSLNPVFTVGSQIAENLRYNADLSRADAKRRAIEMMALVGIPSPRGRADDYPHQLSGGLRQRVMIAMALSCDPEVLIADEPTTALDVTIQAQILDLLKDLQQRLGMAILLITHDMGVVADIADDVAVMYAGKIVERGAVADVLGQPQHPYTAALLASVPLISNTDREPLHVIRGVVPDSAAWPDGCRFAPRCELALDRCSRDSPPFFAVGNSQSACWLRQPTTGLHRGAETG